MGDRAVYVRCRDREPDGRIVAYDLRRRTTTLITTAPDRGLDPVAAPGWVAYASSTTVGVELARLREATRRMRFVGGADVYDVQADGKLAFIAGTRAGPGNGPVIAELGWAARARGQRRSRRASRR